VQSHDVTDEPKAAALKSSLNGPMQAPGSASDFALGSIQAYRVHVTIKGVESRIYTINIK
jgi:hypothetical protein